MPKISYLDILDNGADYTEVTASHIEQKIADIEALLRGMIDEDNMLCAPDGTSVVPLSPSNVADMPVETRPVQQCMKFFGITTSHDTGIVERLFADTCDLSKNIADFRLVGGIYDKEIYIELGADSVKKSNTIHRTLDMGIPNFWSVVTAVDLWNIIAPSGELEVDVLDYSITAPTASGVFVKTFVLDDVDRFAKQVLYCKDRNDIVYEAGYNVQSGSCRLKTDAPSYNPKTNNISYSCTYNVWDEGVYSARYYISALCRVNP
jgi:hypothetical protein